MYVYYLYFYFYLIPTLNQGIKGPQNSYPLSLHPLYKVDPENYCREKLLLYIPWQQNELKILEKFKTYIDAYNHFQKQIHEKMEIYEPAAQIIEHALLEYEEHPDKFIPNSSSTIEMEMEWKSIVITHLYHVSHVILRTYLLYV